MYEMKRIVIHGDITLDSTRTVSSYKHPDCGEQKRFCHKTVKHFKVNIAGALIVLLYGPN